MKTYLVGGAVRDKLLGITPHDKDYVVIGSTHEEMLAKGFLPVGKSHSVYLHPLTREEYSLAKNLKDDLGRRDLTINALAMEDDKILDFFGGEEDLAGKILRHVKESNFYEDPLRVYRVARFLSQFPDFSIAHETFLLMKEVVKGSLFPNLIGERIFQELSKALSGKRPSLFFTMLKNINALPVHFLELEHLDVSFLDRISDRNESPMIRFACLFIDSDTTGLNNFFNRLLVPNDWRDAARTINRFYSEATNIPVDAANIVDLFYKMDGYRKDHLVRVLTEVMEAGGKPMESKKLQEYYLLTKDVSAKDISVNVQGKEIGEAIREARINKLKNSFLI